LFIGKIELTVLKKPILAICGCVLASTLTLADGKPAGFALTQANAQQMKLEVTQTPLPKALEGIAQTAGITLHYSGLSGKPVNAVCVGQSAKQILECLLDKKANLVFRYGQEKAMAHGNVLVEAWVLGSDTGQVRAGDVVTVKPPVGMGEHPQARTPDGSDMGNLLEMAQADDPERRAEAIATLALHRQASDPAIRNALETALTDKSAEVRAQAVSALAKYGDADAAAGLAAALQDNDVSVRLMVVDSADGHPALLEQALNDSDETVRTYASTKLESLAAR